jgi:hypothetical protein
MGYLASISHHAWLERFSAVPQPFLSRISAVFSRFSAQKRLATSHTVSMGNGDFELFLHVLGSLNAIDSKFCVVTPSTKINNTISKAVSGH